MVYLCPPSPFNSKLALNDGFASCIEFLLILARGLKKSWFWFHGRFESVCTCWAPHDMDTCNIIIIFIVSGIYWIEPDHTINNINKNNNVHNC